MSADMQTYHHKAKSTQENVTKQHSTLLIALSNPGWDEISVFGLALILFIGLIWYGKNQSLKRKAQELRKQIAEDFHDELGSKLSVISMYSELIRREVPQDNDLAKHYLHKISQASNSLYLAMKDMLWTLDPDRDSLDDLLIKIKDFGEELFEDSSVEFFMQGLENNSSRIQLSLDHKRHLLLFFKEGLNNVLRHAEATQVRLTFAILNGRLTIVLNDNGKGMDTSAIPPGEGIKNMQNRAKKMNAQFDLTSSKNGTTISLHCPVS